MLRTTSLLSTACLLWVLSLAGCGDDADEGYPVVDHGQSYAGSCDFPATFSCSDYGYPQATAQSQSECASSGGTWSEAQCPTKMRFAVCTSTLPSTRSYAYSTEAAASLMGTCPIESFETLFVEPVGGEGGEGGAAGSAGAAGTAGSAGAAGSAGGDEDAGT